MELVNNAIFRDMDLVDKIREVVYSNPIHLRGIQPYKDKKRLHTLRVRLEEKGQLLRRKDLQFLERLLLKYS